jgi:hypothetical protein
VEPSIVKTKSDSAFLGIIAGLGIGIGTWVGCAVLILFLLDSSGPAVRYLNLVLVVPFLVPPAAVAYYGIIARRSKRSKFAAGLFIAAAVVGLLEATCATTIWR